MSIRPSDEVWQEALRNRRLVVTIARRYQGRGVDLDDMIEVGLLGYCRAIEGHKASIGPLKQYAGRVVQDFIVKLIVEESRGIRLPRWAATSAIRLLRCRTQQEDLGWFNKQSAKRRAAIEHATSIYLTTTYTDETDYGQAYLQEIPDPNDCPADFEPFDVERFHQVDHLISDLDFRERYIVRASFGVGRRQRTLEELARAFGLTKGRVGQIKNEAVAKLRVTASTAN
jgi:RNA polymerase primary sigma factor